jgi:hypothetical protein
VWVLRAAEAAPRPVAAARAESDPHRVGPDVVARVGEIALVFDRLGLEAALEEVADAAVAVVEGGRVETVQPLHPV